MLGLVLGFVFTLTFALAFALAPVLALRLRLAVRFPLCPGLPLLPRRLRLRAHGQAEPCRHAAERSPSEELEDRAACPGLTRHRSRQVIEVPVIHVPSTFLVVSLLGWLAGLAQRRHRRDGGRTGADFLLWRVRGDVRRPAGRRLGLSETPGGPLFRCSALDHQSSKVRQLER
jgi:hypothetical protein